MRGIRMLDVKATKNQYKFKEEKKKRRKVALHVSLC